MKCGRAAGIIREVAGTAEVIPKIVGALCGFDCGLGVFTEEGNP